jgi:hypothetical protein
MGIPPIGEIIMFKHLLVVRHGWAWNEGEDPPLTPEGEQQVKHLRGIIIKFYKEAYGEERSYINLCFSSNARRAIQTVGELGLWSDTTILMPLFYAEREDGEPVVAEVFNKMVAFADFCNAKMVTIASHGSFPAVLAEEAVKRAGGKFHGPLPSPSTASGFLVCMETGEVFEINPRDPEAVPLPRAPKVVTEPKKLKPSKKEKRPISPDDDDIPF